MTLNHVSLDDCVKWKQSKLTNEKIITFYLRNHGPSFEELAVHIFALALDDVKRNCESVDTGVIKHPLASLDR